MSASPATSRQQRVFLAYILAAYRLAMTYINPNRGDYQRFFKRRREFNRGFVALVHRLMAETPDYTRARSILGGDFITAEEIMTARPDIVYSPEQITELAATIPPEDVLRSLKANGYGLMPKQSGFVWLAIKKTSVDGSMNKNWDEQNKLMTSDEYVPNAAKTRWFATVFFDVRGVRLFGGSVRTNDPGSDNDHVCVHYGPGGLYISHIWDSHCLGGLGLASAWKL